MGLLAIGVIALIGACTPNTETAPNRQSNLKETDMHSKNDTAMSAVNPIPPIDAAAADVFETASFGLG
jgi:hypothetical protein